MGYAETGATLDFDRCSFRGQLLTTWQSNALTSRGCSGFVGENRGSATLSGCMYDLNGRLLPGKPQKGMYIHNGKKVIAQ